MKTLDDPDRRSSDFDRLMTAWFDAEARVHEPDDLLDRTIARTAQRRPRPAWLLPERWIPMQRAIQPVRLPRVTPYVVALVLLILFTAVAIAIVGSQRRLPNPFGPAMNGVVTYETPDGDIAAVDPITGVSRTIVASTRRERSPVFSLDGTRIAFIRTVDQGDAVFVVDADGGEPLRVTGVPLPTPGLLAWSPDGRRLAFVSSGKLWIAETDRSDAHRIDLDMPIVDELEWRPPAGDALLVRGIRDGKAALYLLDADGSDPSAITPVDGGEFDYLWVTWSPDGRRVAYHRMTTKHVEVVTIGEGHPVVLHPEGDLAITFPRFSTDGRRLAVMAWLPDATGAVGHRQQIGVLSADDPTPAVTLTGPTFQDGIQFDWSPDGTEILAAGWTSDQPWIIDPAGGPGTKAAWAAAFPDWIEWQRRVP